MENKKIPVILDTDIGSDIDDTWALAMLLRSPELDLKYIITSEDNTVHKAKLTAKICAETGHGDVPIGIGFKTIKDEGINPQAAWVGDYELSDYPGKIYEDGIAGFIETVMACDEKVTVLAVGPLQNIALSIVREPKIADKIRIIGALGSIYKGHSDDHPDSEYNLRARTAEAQNLLRSSVEIIFVPLDVTAHIVVGGENYQKLLKAREDGDVYAKCVLDNFDAWMVANNCTYYKTHSTCLYDTAAVYRAISDELFETEDLPIWMDDGAYTKIDPERGKMINCAVRWKDQEAFHDYVTARILGAI
ncbi:MAG: nucleoside hydrolase [Clostridia bacterium]|nr:nucleoside hydrolase [Clostridia bacterium]